MENNFNSDNLNERIEVYERKQKRDKKIIILLLIIIIILIHSVCFRIGRIGFIGSIDTSITDIITGSSDEELNNDENNNLGNADIETDDSKGNSNGSYNKTEKDSIKNNGNVDGNTNGSGSGKDNDNSSENGAGTGTGSGNGDSGNSGTDTYPDGMIEIIKVVNGKIEKQEDAQLDIFNNKDFDGQKIIKPGSNGSYEFGIRNISSENVIYDISFLDEMTNPINMKYKLKIDNIYIRGDEKYIDIEDLNVKNVIVPANSINLFTLEWSWEDDDVNDTYVGSQEDEQSYTLTLNIDAEVYKK